MKTKIISGIMALGLSPFALFADDVINIKASQSNDYKINEISQQIRDNTSPIQIAKLKHEYLKNTPVYGSSLIIGQGIIPALANSTNFTGTYGAPAVQPGIRADTVTSQVSGLMASSLETTKSISDSLKIKAGFGPFSISNSATYTSSMKSTNKDLFYYINAQTSGASYYYPTTEFYDKSDLKGKLKEYMRLKDRKEQKIIDSAYQLIATYGFGMLERAQAGIQVTGVLHLAFSSESDAKSFSDKTKASYTSLDKLNNDFKTSISSVQDNINITIKIDQIGGNPEDMPSPGDESNPFAAPSGSSYIDELAKYFGGLKVGSTKDLNNFGVSQGGGVITIADILYQKENITKDDFHYVALQEIMDKLNSYASSSNTIDKLNKISDDLASINTAQQYISLSELITQYPHDTTFHANMYLDILKKESTWAETTLNEFIANTQNLAQDIVKQSNLTTNSLKDAYAKLIDETINKIDEHKKSLEYLKAQALINTPNFSVTSATNVALPLVICDDATSGPIYDSKELYVISQAPNFNVKFDIDSNDKDPTKPKSKEFDISSSGGASINYNSVSGFSFTSDKLQIWGSFFVTEDKKGNNTPQVEPLYVITGLGSMSTSLQPPATPTNRTWSHVDNRTAGVSLSYTNKLSANIYLTSPPSISTYLRIT